MGEEQKTTTDANRRISGDDEDSGTRRAPADNDVADADDRISREASRAREQLRREQALKRPAD